MPSRWRFPALVMLAVVLTLPAAAPRAHAAKSGAPLPEPETFGRFTVDQVERRLGRPDTYVFDGNKPETYAERHVPGAVRLNHKDIAPAVLPQDKDATLIFYCMNEL